MLRRELRNDDRLELLSIANNVSSCYIDNVWIAGGTYKTYRSSKDGKPEMRFLTQANAVDGYIPGFGTVAITDLLKCYIPSGILSDTAC